MATVTAAAGTTATAATEGASEVRGTRSSVPVEPTQAPARAPGRVSKSAPPPPVPLRLLLGEPSHREYHRNARAAGMLAALRGEVLHAMRTCVRSEAAHDAVGRQWDACAAWARDAHRAGDRAHCGAVDGDLRVVALAALRLYTMPAPCTGRGACPPVYAVLNRFLRERTRALEDTPVPAGALRHDALAPWNNYLWFLLLAIRAIRYGVCKEGGTSTASSTASTSSGKEEEEMPERVYHGVVAQAAGALETDSRRKILRSVTSAAACEATARGFGGGDLVVVLHGAGPRLCAVAPVSAVPREREYLFEPMTLFDAPATPLTPAARWRAVEPELFELEREEQTRWLLDWRETFMGSLTLEDGPAG